MKLPILTSVLVLCLVIAYVTHKGKNEAKEQIDEFWAREREANNTRRKSLDGLNYIQIPLEELPITLFNEDNIIAEATATIVELSKSPIVNLTGISNTDLKLQYGAPNIDLLSLYDSRYTTLARTLQQWGNRLFELGDKDAAKAVLEFAISTGTDVSGTYKLLSSLYIDNHTPDANTKLDHLISEAQKLNSPMKDAILKDLHSKKQLHN